MAIFGWVPGMGVEDAANREILAGQLKDDGTGIKEGKYNWQDKFGGLLGGYDREAVEATAQRLRDEALSKKLNREYAITGTNLKGLGLNPEYIGNVTGIEEQKLSNQINSDIERLTAAEGYYNTKNAKGGSLDPDASASQITSAASTLRDANVIAKEKKIQREVERQEGRSDDLLTMQMLQNQAENDRAYNFQMNQMNYNNRALDLKEARLDRRDRQAAIAQLMAGLSQLGTSIAA